MDILVNTLLNALNEILAVAIVIVALSLLLYNLSRNLQNRVARTSGGVLACVSIVFLMDSFISLEPSIQTMIAATRLQWIGIAFIPASMFHLSDALLATTGLPSRGRRRRIVRILYLLSAVFLVLATFSNLLILPQVANGQVILQPSSLMWLYILFLLSASITTFINVDRARRRCLTRSTQRRMAYLQAAILTPALGIFPYSVLLTPLSEQSLFITLLVVIANGFIITMLFFLSYPLSFFGSDKPDRVVKSDLLRFLLHGPATGLLALATIIFTTRGGRIFSLPSEALLPFAVVGVVLLWQWFIALAMPRLERFLIYRSEADEQIAKLEELAERVLTRSDLVQFVEATLESCCDLLRSNSAFVIRLNGETELLSYVGQGQFDVSSLAEAHESWLSTLAGNDEGQSYATWGRYQITWLVNSRRSNNEKPLRLGLLAIESQDTLNALEPESSAKLASYYARLADTLDDIQLQEDIFAALEGLLPQIGSSRTDEMEYKPGYSTPSEAQRLPNKEDFYEQVRAALRHYWGGPGITRSRLFDLSIVKQHLNAEEMPVQALRAVLQEAIDRQRPEGERSYNAPEWTIYNILVLRFVDGKKVRDVARRMNISEPDLYRKQRLAIDALGDTILEMERHARQSTPHV